MTTSRNRGISAVALLTGLLGFGLTGSATAEPLPNETAPGCLRPSDGTGTNTPAPGQTEDANTAGYESGSGSIKSGRLATNFQPIVPSCPGATYAFTVSSVDGTALGWTTTDTVPGGNTVVSLDGLSATVTFTGDGQTQAFRLSGTTGKAYDKRNTCVGLSLTASLAGASYTWPEGSAQRVCVPPAGSYYG